MKIFIIMYFFGKSVAALGPYNTDMKTCETRLIPQREAKDAIDWEDTVSSGRVARLKGFRGPADTTYKCKILDAGMA